MNIIFVCIIIISFFFSECKADKVIKGCNGQIKYLIYNNQQEQIQLNTDIRFLLNKRFLGLMQIKNLKSYKCKNRKIYKGLLKIEDKKCYLKEIIKENKIGIDISITIISKSTLNIKGICFLVRPPIERFKGGECKIIKKNSFSQRLKLPLTVPKRALIYSGIGKKILVMDSSHNTSLYLSFDKPYRIMLEDNRIWNMLSYNIIIFIHWGRLSKNKHIHSHLFLKVISKDSNKSLVYLRVDPSIFKYKYHGIGGNYCFFLESSVSQYTFNNLPITWIRMNMPLDKWEPYNDNDSPYKINWKSLIQNDTDRSILRANFLFAKKVQKKGIPYCMSIFRLPEWMYAEPGKGKMVKKRRVPRSKWPELLECIKSFLLYAKYKYGIEPTYISFNEPDAGAYVLFSPKDYGIIITKIGRLLKQIGSKTKILLGDVSSPRKPQYLYVLKTLSVPKVLQYVGAIGFHSWGGATSEEYKRWTNLAKQIGCDLLVTEFGVDPSAWRCKSYTSYEYGLDEVSMYLELLLFAQPRFIVYWQFTKGYSLVKEQITKSLRVNLIPTKRFWFIKQLSCYTPKNSYVLETWSDDPKVLFVAFRGFKGNYTFHICNRGISKKIIISDLPIEIKNLVLIQTTQKESCRKVKYISVKERKIVIRLPHRSLITLTTLGFLE